MRNVHFNAEVVKELRRLARDFKHGKAFEQALRKIYEAGYDNAQHDATRQIRRAIISLETKND